MKIRNGRVVRIAPSQPPQDQGHPAELAGRFDLEGADELVFFDISTPAERKSSREAWVVEVAHTLSIPFTVGGGVESLEDIRALLQAGADKIALNSAVVRNPSLMQEAASLFGRQCLVAAVEVRRDPEGVWRVFVRGENTGLEALPWIGELERLGAGEILLTSLDRDGTREGLDLDLIEAASRRSIPLMTSGGVGSREDFQEAIHHGADAVLATTFFHDRTLSIPALKMWLVSQGVQVRQ